ncbi:uncharacterized protein HKW66_Vig0255810 [Vigna angularis]|uniref:Uncharacterized protein n=1 Tax=Phaseolus angularis TaxID=3914 RepID=A0A8T0JT19_PHAAN|nr:uncharacterized protein HKW66_Vig0255810 [Vigna angularis]
MVWMLVKRGTQVVEQVSPSSFTEDVTRPPSGSKAEKKPYTFSIQRSEKHANHSCNKFFIHAARNDHHISYDDGLPEEPFLLSLIKDVIWGLKYLFVFLAEQPSQLKYVEWPSFSSTLRTAILTLILVALLIVALSSVDSALCYLLALALRKKP